MRRLLSIVLGAVGLWLFVPGLVSVIGRPPGVGSATPSQRSGLLLGVGAVLIAGAVMLWRRGARDRAGDGRESGTHPQPAAGEHAVIVHLKLSDDSFGTAAERDSIHALTSEMERRIEAAQAGEFDGDEFGNGECSLYMYGPDADRLFAAVEAVLRGSPHTKGGYAIKRYGAADDPAAREARVEL